MSATSLAFSSDDNSTTAVITVSQPDGTPFSFPISSVTGGEDEATLFAAITSALTAYRTTKGF